MVCRLAGGTAAILFAVAAVAADVKFVHVSDMHYLTDYSNCTSRTALALRLNGLPDKTLPGSTGLVGNIEGVLATGDITDGYATGQARTNQWLNFLTDYGLNGSDGLVHFPVYEGWGNHDQDSWSAIQNVYIPARNIIRPDLLYYSGPHYSWNWGPVHLVQMNIRVGSTTARYNSHYSYQFLTNDLARNVGDSRRPVFIMHHLNVPNANGDWPTNEQSQYYAAISNYNVIAIIWGHLGGSSSVGRWNGIRTVFTAGNSDTLFWITNGMLKIIQRSGTDWAGAKVTTDAIYVPTEPGAVLSTGGSNITETTADATGEIRATNADPTQVSIFWGPTDGRAKKSAWSNEVAFGTGGLGTIAANVTGLPGQVLYYRCYLSNAFGEQWTSPTATIPLVPEPGSWLLLIGCWGLLYRCALRGSLG